MLKNFAFAWEAILLAMRVLPVPGGPNRRTPRGGHRTPVNKSGRRSGMIMASRNVDFADSRPAISSQAEIGEQVFYEQNGQRDPV